MSGNNESFLGRGKRDRSSPRRESWRKKRRKTRPYTRESFTLQRSVVGGWRSLGDVSVDSSQKHLRWCLHKKTRKLIPSPIVLSFFGPQKIPSWSSVEGQKQNMRISEERRASGQRSGKTCSAESRTERTIAIEGTDRWTAQQDTTGLYYQQTQSCSISRRLSLGRRRTGMTTGRARERGASSHWALWFVPLCFRGRSNEVGGGLYTLVLSQKRQKARQTDERSHNTSGTTQADARRTRMIGFVLRESQPESASSSQESDHQSKNTEEPRGHPWLLFVQHMRKQAIKQKTAELPVSACLGLLISELLPPPNRCVCSSFFLLYSRDRAFRR